MVRRWPARRLPRFRWRGKCRRSFLRHDGTTWTTDKDGMVAALLAAEITARSGRDPGQRYREIAGELGDPLADRLEAPADAEQKARLAKLSPAELAGGELAGEKITNVLDRARATRRRSAASRSVPPAAGSPHGHPAPRRSTRSTPRASRAVPTCKPSCSRHRRWSTAHSRRAESACNALRPGPRASAGRCFGQRRSRGGWSMPATGLC
jgi:hypothetical protein